MEGHIAKMSYNRSLLLMCTTQLYQMINDLLDGRSFDVDVTSALVLVVLLLMMLLLRLRIIVQVCSSAG